MVITEDITSIVDQATSVAKSAADAASNSGVAQDLKNKLLQASAKINGIASSITDNGFISSEDYAALDEQMRLAKSSILQAQSKNTLTKYAVGGAIILVVFGVLWYITKDK
jgi:hypothetical protein